MANLILTNVCNLNCPFCFATEHHETEDSVAATRLSLTEYQRLLKFIGEEAVRFCGGEPTLHPEFPQMLDLALEKRGREVFIMSNGVWPDRVRTHIARLGRGKRKRIGYLFNVLSEEHYRPQQRVQLQRTLETVSPTRVTLGVTLYRAPHHVDHLFELAQHYGVSRIRYSVAAPNVTDPRSWNIDAERDFPLLASVVYGLVMRAQRLGLKVYSDCGYLPPCMFTEEQLDAMYPNADAVRAEAFSCRGPTDIGAGHQSWRCYGLYSTMRADVNDFPHVGALSAHFARRTAELDHVDLFDCATCEIRERYACAGGCYALRSVQRMQARAQTALVSIGNNSTFHEAQVRVCSESVRFVQRGDVPVVMLKEREGDWVQLHLSRWETEILSNCIGEHTVGEVLRMSNSSMHRPGPASVGCETSAARVVRRLYEQGALVLTRTRQQHSTEESI